jgi:hypothetical protein
VGAALGRRVPGLDQAHHFFSRLLEILLKSIHRVNSIAARRSENLSVQIYLLLAEFLQERLQSGDLVFDSIPLLFEAHVATRTKGRIFHHIDLRSKEKRTTFTQPFLQAHNYFTPMAFMVNNDPT